MPDPDEAPAIPSPASAGHFHLELVGPIPERPPAPEPPAPGPPAPEPPAAIPSPASAEPGPPPHGPVPPEPERPRRRFGLGRVALAGLVVAGLAVAVMARRPPVPEAASIAVGPAWTRVALDRFRGASSLRLSADAPFNLRLDGGRVQTIDPGTGATLRLAPARGLELRAVRGRVTVVLSPRAVGQAP